MSDHTTCTPHAQYHCGYNKPPNRQTAKPPNNLYATSPQYVLNVLNVLCNNMAGAATLSAATAAAALERAGELAMDPACCNFDTWVRLHDAALLYSAALYHEDCVTRGSFRCGTTTPLGVYAKLVPLIRRANDKVTHASADEIYSARARNNAT